MIRINQNYLKLQSSYLFSEIDKRVNAFQKAHPALRILGLAIKNLLGLILLIAGIIMCFTAVQFRIGNRWVYYEGKV